MKFIFKLNVFVKFFGAQKAWFSDIMCKITYKIENKTLDKCIC